ncbi:anti-adapter protein IraM [Escherichia coli]
MKWIVIDTVIQPSCGISFSAIWSKIKLIIWYQSDVTIYNVVPFNKRFWDLIKNSQECPANSDNVLKECFNNHCILQICPYGLKQQCP